MGGPVISFRFKLYELGEKIDTVVQQIPTASEIKEINNMKNKLKKPIKFMEELDHLGIKMGVDVLKWIAFNISNFKAKEKVISNVLDILKVSNEVKELFTKEIIEKFEMGAFDDSVLWFENFLIKLQNSKESLQRECTVKQEKARKLDDDIRTLDNKKKLLEKELTKKKEWVEEESFVISKIFDLLKSGKKALDLVNAIEKAGGVIGWLTGRRKKAKKVICTLEETCSSLNELKSDLIKKRNLSEVSIDTAMEIVRSEIDKDLQQARSKIMYENRILDIEKEKITEINVAISNCGNHKNTRVNERDSLFTKIKNITKEGEDIEKLVINAKLIRNKCPIFNFLKGEDIVCTSYYRCDDREEVIYGGLKTGNITLSPIFAEL